MAATAAVQWIIQWGLTEKSFLATHLLHTTLLVKKALNRIFHFLIYIPPMTMLSAINTVNQIHNTHKLTVDFKVLLKLSYMVFT